MELQIPTSPHATLRAAEPADVPAVLTLLRAHEAAVSGEPSWNEGEVAEPFTTDKGRRDTRMVVGERDGAVVAHFLATRDTADRWYGDATVDVSLPAAAHADLTHTGLAWVERTAATNAEGTQRVRITHWCWENDARFAESLAAAGYQPVRAFIEMHLDLDGRASTPPTDAVRIRQADLSDLAGPDARMMYELISESFRDHYDYHERTYDEWLERRTAGANYDPDGWFIAEVDGTPAGGLIHDTGYVAEHGANYVANLGTLRWARGRGVAKALLEHSFARAAAQGRRAVKLHVDAESPTGATALYESVGMHRHKVGQEWQRFVPVC
ncbi:GNAT family N-acetyltransferase [Cumulibacter manganitolerans]|uniref:GNAT family N-acetyltransferase n=1 Tax=Cumulibacter manganitolerans TaxID=1884992 RepID=UPI001294BF36|nr:GNAT family N-acetyltransferase [Cumulibacter manganitolerans]